VDRGEQAWPGHPYWPYLDHLSYPEFGTLRAEDGQTLYYSVTKPYGFDAAKRYPAIVSVYGGPGVSTVRKRWAGGTDQLLTQSGYVVFRLDNRGASNRGLKFEAPIHKAMGGAEVGIRSWASAIWRHCPLSMPRASG
jgi:dipeptidyl-peptidase-4